MATTERMGVDPLVVIHAAIRRVEGKTIPHAGGLREAHAAAAELVEAAKEVTDKNYYTLDSWRLLTEVLP